MNFQNLRKVEGPDFYLDVAFRRAKEKSDLHRGKVKIQTRLSKSQQVEIYRMEVMKSSITNQMESILKSFPTLDELPPFYNALVKITLDYDKLKKSLGCVGWARQRTEKLFNIYKGKIKKCEKLEKINGLRTEFSGRVASHLKQIKAEFEYLEAARRVMKSYPNVKTSLPTVAIAGFPNVGKTTLLSKLTGSKPDIQPYAFTTKEINVGYLIFDDKKIQLLDTPGTLNRFEKMNWIEKIASLAIELCADKIVYIFDLTETSYPLSDQIELYDKLKAMDKEIVCYLSKTDILEQKRIKEFSRKIACVTDAEKLKGAIAAGLKERSSE